MKQIILTCSLIALLAACKDETLSGYAPEETTWVLESLNGSAFDANATLTFPQKGKIAGKGPCNGFRGTQSVPYPWFSVEGIASTKMTCPQIAQETQFFEALQKMTLSEVSGDTLILSNEEGSQMLFRAVP